MPKQRRRSPKRPRAEASRVRHRFEKLLSAGIAIYSERSLERVLQQIVDSARDVVGARYAALGVLAPDGTSLSEFVTSGLSRADRDRIGALPTGHGLLGLVIREARPIRTADISHHVQRSGFPPAHPPMKSFLGVPIRGRDRAFGNLYLTEKIGAAEFDAEDQAIAVLLAAHAAVAVENARLNDEAQRLLSQVRDMQRHRDLFFAMMNHELRNALTGVFGWAERLVRGKSADGASQAAREVYEGAEHTITLLNNFLDLTRLDAGKVRPVWRDVNALGAVQRSVAGMQPAVDAKRIVIAVDCPPDASLLTDPVRLEQILLNLLSNAVRHSPQGERIAVRVEAADSTVSFHVVDHGPGIAPELQGRIFEPFERFDPHSGLGTGLGLPVSRRLAEVLGGSLTVASDVGRGADFALTLPHKAGGV
ncbi:MAG TPA: GAF domain-containing sensor histidine kinase [Gemmatimonadales bacterium]|nr:GAF domain-containing sensor histidine kinase [Gemmatimonadales bacterium]